MSGSTSPDQLFGECEQSLGSALPLGSVLPLLSKVGGTLLQKDFAIRTVLSSLTASPMLLFCVQTMRLCV
jgi:hypothetical protein